MSQPVIRVEGLGKRYILSHQAAKGGQFRYQRFSDKVIDTVKAPLRWLRRGSGGSISQTSRSPLPASSEEFWALEDVSFEIKQGETVGIIGRNGAGKSTLLKLLSRITEPTKGRITLNGRVASLLEVGTGFHPELTGRENIFLNGAILGMTRAEIAKKFDEIVTFAEVEKFLDTPVKRYSSGMYVRLAFAVAAHLEPEILIVDEVLAVGDAEFQKKCLGKMQEVAGREGRTVIFVSHNMTAVRNLCKHGLLMVNGRKRFEGPIEATIAAYLSSHQTLTTLLWQRPANLPATGMIYTQIELSLLGRQPHLLLQCEITLQATGLRESSFVAVDVCDQLQTPIMQAIPLPRPFIPGRNGEHRIRLEIDLPPMIPGQYTLDFWVGTHFSTTLDYVKNAVTFEVVDSPVPERTFPYSPNHGFLVPVSRYKLLTVE